MFYSCSTLGGHHGIALVVKESMCKTSKFTREDVNERLMSMRFEMSDPRLLPTEQQQQPTEKLKNENKNAQRVEND